MTDQVRSSAAAAIVAAALFLDAAVETFVAGSPVRWWVAGGATLALLGAAVAWRAALSWRHIAAGAAVGLLALIALTAWLTGGLTNGIRLLGLRTPAVLALVAAMGIALGGFVVADWRRLPLGARIAAGLIALYGVAAFALAAIGAVPMSQLLAGESLWQRLPAVLQGAFIGGLVFLPIAMVIAAVRAGLRRPAESSARAGWWKVVGLATSFTVVLAGLPQRAASSAFVSPAPTMADLLGIDPNAPKASPAELEKALTNALRAIEDGERESPRDRWDPAYVAAALGNDPQRIFEWTRDNTFWIPYRGLLRGAVGVLMDRLGSSLDRAALLATMLRASGRQVRLANGTLAAEQAPAVLRDLVLARYGAWPAGAGQSIEVAQLSAVAGEYQLDTESLQRLLHAHAEFATRRHERLSQHVADQTARLVSAVGTGSVDQQTPVLARAHELLQDHWWVQVLDGAAWQDADLAASSMGASLTAATRIVELDAFPDDLQHQLTIRVVAEQWAGGALTEKVALQHSLRLSQLIGTPIALRFIPSRWPKDFPAAGIDLADGLRKMALDQREWVPSVAIGNDAVAQMAIRDTGDVAPPADPAAQLGGAIGGKAGGLAKAFEDALGPSTPAPSPQPGPSRMLTSVSLEYEIQQPGERTRKIRRTVFDLLGPAARAAGSASAPTVDERAALTRSLAMMREVEILPVVCRLTPTYVTHLAAQSVLAHRDLLQRRVRGTLPDHPAKFDEFAKQLGVVPTRLYALALARSQWSSNADVFIDTPNILTRHMFLSTGPQGFKLVDATDIVANEVGVGFLTDNAFAARLEQGVVDTNLEALVASDQPTPSNAGWAFASSREWITLRSPADPQLAALRLDDDVRRRIADDLSAGYVVVAPKAPIRVSADTFSGWWRVDPRTGHTLGMGASGWGQDFVEFLITAALTIQLWMFFTFFFCRLGGGSVGACRDKAYDSGIMATLTALLVFLAPAMAPLAFAPKGLPGPGLGGRGPGPKPSPGPPPKGPGNTQPLDPVPFDKTLPAGPPGGKPNSPGPGRPGRGNPDPTPGADAALDGAGKKFYQAEKKWLDSGMKDDNAYQEMIDAIREQALITNPPQLKPYTPPVGSPASGHTVKPGPGASGNPAPTGPTGTQIITGPGGTKIIPDPSISPTAPTQPALCPPYCPQAPQGKTLNGLGAVLNTLGKSGGGG